MQDSVPLLTLAGMLLGGLGLFLLAVSMLTNGLRLAAGRALREFLSHSTSTPLRGIASGIVITAIVQSSSAVTVATIGFVNAGLLNLYQSLGVVFGANVGTTMTGWLVAAVGFDLDVKAFALPMVGVGMLLRLTGAGNRRGAIGEALTGFGLFFIGIDILKEAFSGYATGAHIPQVPAGTTLTAFIFLWVGFLLTVLTQSSSAAIALILTAASGGILDLSSAAAMVIGANVGTTTTAAIAVIGATPNAKRVAAAHIVFNLLTAVVAIALLPVLLWLVGYTGQLLHLQSLPAVTLALFHTVFNVLGVLLMLPFSRRLAGYLEKRFRTAEEIEGAPRFLDRTIAVAPELAMNALSMELDHLGGIARRMAVSALSTEHTTGQALATDKAAVRQLSLAIGEFISQISRASINVDISERLSQVLRISDYYDEVAATALAYAVAEADLEPLDEALGGEPVARYRAAVIRLLTQAGPFSADFDLQGLESMLTAINAEYSELKNRLLQAGAVTKIDIAVMGEQLEQLWRTRRMARQAVKAARYLTQLKEAVAVETNDMDGPDESAAAQA